MKATGIVRRIDDLGRVVIPKEIRRTLGIKEGDPLEIYTDNGACVLKRYSPMGNYHDQLEVMYNTLKGEGINCAIYDYAGGKVKGGNGFPRAIDREEFEENPNKYLTIKVQGEVQGYVLADASITQEQRIMLKTCAMMIQKLLEANE